MDQLSASIEQHARDVLPTVTRVFIFVYLVIGCSHFLLLPDELTLPMSLLAFATFGYGVLIRYNLHRKVVETYSEHVLLSFVLLAAVNTLVHLFLTGELKHTTNLIFVLAVGGYLMPRNQIFYPVLVVVLLSWASIVATGQTDGDDLAHLGFEVLLGCLFSVFLQMLRRSQLEQMGDLEQSVDQLNQSQQRVSASESLLQSLMDNIPAGILVRSPKSRKFLFVNDVARELLNFHGVVGQSEVDVDLFDRQGNVLSQLDAPISRLDRGEIVENEVMGLRRADGSNVWGW